MNKPDLADAIIPHLLAALPDPFNPDEQAAERVHKTALKWAELIFDQKKKGGGYSMLVP